MTDLIFERVAVVAIGRNEGERLVACLTSALQDVAHVVYVDSGSTDGSVARARELGAEVVELDLSTPFTAARARNAGLKALGADAPEFVQFVDGDCILDPNWIASALAFLIETPKAAVVCGRLRERFPEASVYNRLCDMEWDTPIGEAKACGGIAMMRVGALREVQGFNPHLIAGEEPELCARLRKQGWQIWRIDAEMALHDAAITRFGQFWKRMRRSGFAYAQGAAMHGNTPDRLGVRGRNSALRWGLYMPIAILLAALVVGPVALLGVLIFPMQVARLTLRRGGARAAFEEAVVTVLGKFAEVRGIFEFLATARFGKQARLIEYK